jgi:hypothetical protein
MLFTNNSEKQNLQLTAHSKWKEKYPILNQSIIKHNGPLRKSMIDGLGGFRMWVYLLFKILLYASKTFSRRKLSSLTNFRSCFEKYKIWKLNHKTRDYWIVYEDSHTH